MAERTPDQIWADDLLGRRNEAEQILAYLESVSTRRFGREDKQAFTLAVEAGYGEGKTFFLTRLTEHLSLNHPVAFVDAWADDLSDEPLTALAATLKQALEPLLQRPDLRERLTDFMTKAGTVATIITSGLFKRVLGLAITGGAVMLLEDVMSGSDEPVRSALNEGAAEPAKGIVEDAAKGPRGATGGRTMDERVEHFEAGRRAVQSMKDSLRAIIAALPPEGLSAPIVIVIDELDRCRPNYAVKLLEEVKHLFDVPGIVFILAMNADQLAHSVSGAYGAKFDGRAYLSRFIDREYRLALPGLLPLVEFLCGQAGINPAKFKWYPTVYGNEEDVDLSLPALISEYMLTYGLRSRDAFKVLDILQTCQALVSGSQLRLEYLLPLIFGHIRGLPKGDIPPPVASSRFQYFVLTDRATYSGYTQTFAQTAEKFQSASQLTVSELHASGAAINASMPEGIVRARTVQHSVEQPLSSMQRYPDLLLAVSRFENPRVND
jgi:hypothetical protein